MEKAFLPRNVYGRWDSLTTDFETTPSADFIHIAVDHLIPFDAELSRSSVDHVDPSALIPLVLDHLVDKTPVIGCLKFKQRVERSSHSALERFNPKQRSISCLYSRQS